jgi:hypothetical protein
MLCWWRRAARPRNRPSRGAATATQNTAACCDADAFAERFGTSEVALPGGLVAVVARQVAVEGWPGCVCGHAQIAVVEVRRGAEVVWASTRARHAGARVTPAR